MKPATKLKVPAELHIYAGSGHGFGLLANGTKPAGKWSERFEEWLAVRAKEVFSPLLNLCHPGGEDDISRAPRASSCLGPVFPDIRALRLPL